MFVHARTVTLTRRVISEMSTGARRFERIFLCAHRKLISTIFITLRRGASVCKHSNDGNVRVLDSDGGGHGADEAVQLAVLLVSHAHMPRLEVARRLQTPGCQVISAPAAWNNACNSNATRWRVNRPLEKVARVVEAELGVGILHVVVVQQLIEVVELWHVTHRACVHGFACFASSRSMSHQAKPGGRLNGVWRTTFSGPSYGPSFSISPPAAFHNRLMAQVPHESLLAGPPNRISARAGCPRMRAPADPLAPDRHQSRQYQRAHH